MNRVVSASLFLGGCLSWYSPGFSGALFEPVSMSAGEGRIVGAIFIVGAAVVWFMPQSKGDT
jgi:hypothetical protein